MGRHRVAATSAPSTFNARFWATLPLTVASGADYPYWLPVLVEGSATFLSPPLGHRRFARWAGEAWRFVTLREWSDTLAPDDPLPGARRPVAHRGSRVA